jgi:hypothetical protein
MGDGHRTKALDGGLSPAGKSWRKTSLNVRQVLARLTAQGILTDGPFGGPFASRFQKNAQSHLGFAGFPNFRPFTGNSAILIV